ncbi:MAG: hypothetical protein UT64_C0002G0035, partial [Candidatus Falkowbacteria bacterium GW2011_GWF2_39_8]
TIKNSLAAQFSSIPGFKSDSYNVLPSTSTLIQTVSCAFADNLNESDFSKYENKLSDSVSNDTVSLPDKISEFSISMEDLFNDVNAK